MKFSGTGTFPVPVQVKFAGTGTFLVPVPAHHCIYIIYLNLKNKVNGFNHADTAASYNNLGVLYDNIGNYLKSEVYLNKALEIREKVNSYYKFFHFK